MPDTTSRSVANWVLQEKIGRGSFAVVWKAIHADTGSCVAVKEISTDRLNKKLKQSLESEVSILKQIRHQNIVRLEDVVEESSCLYLVMEFCAGGDLAGYIHRCKRVPEVTACAVMRQLGAGLKELWSRHMVHRDLKPQNLLLSDHTPQAVLKIADFGFARHLQQHQLADTLCGSPLYMAPEILQSHKYDAKADLWSVGTILYELVVGRPPFNGSNHVALLHNIERHEAKIPDQVARNLSPACTDLIYSLLKRNPVQRMSFEEFFNHPFLAAATPLAAAVQGEAPAPDTSLHQSGMPKPVQRLAGQVATGPEQDLPFVLDDDAVAQVYEERLQQQQQAADPQDAAAQVQALRPRYGHRSPASALAGRQFVQATSKLRPPLGASPRPGGLAGAAKPPSVPNTPPIAGGPLPATALLASSQVQGRAVLNHPLQPARGAANSTGSSLEEDGFVIVNPPSPSSSGHEAISRRASAGWQGNLLTRLRSESLPSHYQHHHSQPQHQPLRPVPPVTPPVQQQQQQNTQRSAHHVPSVPSQSATARHPPTDRHLGRAFAPTKHNAAPAAAVVVRAVAEPEVEPDMGSPRALVGVADLLEERAAEEAGWRQLQSSIALRLLAMQILLAAFRQVATSQHGEAKGIGHHVQPTMQQQQQQQREQATEDQPHGGACQHQQGQQQRPLPCVPGQAVTPQGQEFCVFSKQIKQRLLDMAGRVEDSLSALRQEGESTVVPYVWQVVYQAALAHAQTGATQEIIGGIRSCILSYSQAVHILAFLHSAAEGLSLKPELKLAANDRLRMQSFSLQLRARQAVCKCALHQADAASLD